MIPKQRLLLNRLESCIWIDKKDPSRVRVKFDEALQILYENGVVVPPVQYEESVQRVLNEKIVGKVPADPVPMKIAIGKILYDVSSHLAISEDELLKHKMSLDN